jgi:hypothetical protein
MRKYFVALGFVGIMTILVIGVQAAWFDNDHEANSTTTDWEQYCIDCDKYNDGTHFTSPDTIQTVSSVDRCDDNTGIYLDEDEEVTCLLEGTVIDGGAYHLIIVLDIWRGETSSSGYEPCDFKCGLWIDNVCYFNVEDDYFPASSAPAIDKSLSDPHPLPVDFGIVYFQRDDDSHNIKIEWGNDGTAAVLSLLLDEIVLTPA